MSIYTMNIVWKYAPFSGTKLITLLALADWANDEGLCWPSVKKLAEKSRQSERSVQRCIRDFQDCKLISIEQRPNNSSVYQINLSMLGGDNLSPGDKTERVGVTNQVLGGDTAMSPNTPCIEEPPIQPPIEKKRRSRQQIISEFGEGTKQVVNPIIQIWPKIRPGNQSAIAPDVPLLASRVDEILHSTPSVTPELLLAGAKLYLAEQKQFPHAPEFFFGPGKNGEPPWKPYARMAYHQQRQVAQ